MRHRYSLLVPAALFVAAAASAQEREKVFIPPVKGEKISADTLGAMFDLVVVAVDRAKIMRVVTMDDVNSMLDHEKRKDAIGCSSISCAVELGGALGVRYLLATRAKKLENQILFTASLIDTDKQESKNGLGRCKDRASEYDKAVTSAVAEALGLVTVSLSAQTTAATPSTNIATILVAADVQQPETALFWLRCPVGQNWSGTSCVGIRREMSWVLAQKSCPDGYRPPTVDEYKALLGCSKILDRCNSCGESASCSSMFTEADGYFWTSTASPFFDGGWVVGLRSGGINRIENSANRYLRCVRGGS